MNRTEALVIDLLKKGYTTRAIAKMVNVSNTIIKKIGQKITNNDNEEKSDQKKKPLSV
jgi:transposase